MDIVGKKKTKEGRNSLSQGSNDITLIFDKKEQKRRCALDTSSDIEEDNCKEISKNNG